MKSTVRVEIECFGRYCSNDCPWMRGGESMSCSLFGLDLKWDKRKKENGYLRPTACKQAEGK